MKEIMVIAPTRGIFDAARSLIAEHRYENIEVDQGTMADGLEKARAAVDAGARILVSRGGTYRMCCEAFALPVVEIKVSAYDIIQTLSDAEIRDRVIGVVGYNNVVDGFDILRELLPYEIVKIELSSEAQVQQTIETYRDRGVRTFVGDTNAMRFAKALGCDGFVIDSQRDSIYAAIQSARRISRATALEKQRTRRLQIITDFVHDGVVAVDEEGRVGVCNRAAAELLQVDPADAIGRPLQEVWPQSSLPETLAEGRSEFGRLQVVNGVHIVSTRVPILVDGAVKGGVETFQPLSEIQSIERKARRSMSAKGFTAKYSFTDIIRASPCMERCVQMAREYARYDAPVLITGESGVGKELFAQSIHNESARRGGPFVAVNCAALPPSLIESELFGYEEGSFTGAKKQGKPGVFELAHEGTIFLDEIAELPLDMQGRLLRVLQEKEVMRLGGDRVTPVNVKVICGSNRDLAEITKQGEFRRDLYYRINVLDLRIPPLRERREDIMLLADFFNRLYAHRFGKPPLVFTDEIARRLCAWRFDGNVRELQGLVERCVILSSADSLLSACAGESPLPAAPPAPESAPPEAPSDAALTLREYEDRYIERVYLASGQNIRRTCETLGIDRTTLWRRLRQSAPERDDTE
jgi:transcriptional regulator with PAS, ATPase and Fis domain